MMPELSHVLIVDDNRRMVAMVERWLVRAGYDVMGATTVPEALKLLQDHSLDWVISDLMMPTGDGLDILAYVCSHHPQVKVIIMTAFGSEAMRQRAMAHGAHAFLSKPFSGEALLTILTQTYSPKIPSVACCDQGIR